MAETHAGAHLDGWGSWTSVSVHLVMDQHVDLRRLKRRCVQSTLSRGSVQARLPWWVDGAQIRRRKTLLDGRSIDYTFYGPPLGPTTRAWRRLASSRLHRHRLRQGLGRSDRAGLSERVMLREEAGPISRRLRKCNGNSCPDVSVREQPCGHAGLA
jgi:hypothetical protein